jgi:hypothetical protein
MARSGVHSKVAATRMGHSTPRTYNEGYVHLMPGMQATAVAQQRMRSLRDGRGTPTDEFGLVERETPSLYKASGAARPLLG